MANYPTRSQIHKDPIWTIKGVVANPSLDTFYQVTFSFSKYQTWFQGGVQESTAGQFGRYNSQAYALQAQNFASGSKKTEGLTPQEKLSLLCSEAEIPGTSYLTTQVDGNFQGISETFPTMRQFPPLNLSFYLDHDHVALEVFEQWMKFINPVKNGESRSNAYTRFNYPQTYKETIHLTKYERDFATYDLGQSDDRTRMSQYEFREVWPTNMTSMRLNYGSSDIVRVSLQLAYDRFITQFSVVDSHTIPMEKPFFDGRQKVNNRRTSSTWGTGLFPFNDIGSGQAKPINLSNRSTSGRRIGQ